MGLYKEYTENEYIDIIKKFVKETSFGQITITLQDGKVIQIEQTKKLRLKN